MVNYKKVRYAGKFFILHEEYCGKLTVFQIGVSSYHEFMVNTSFDEKVDISYLEIGKIRTKNSQTISLTENAV